MSWGPEPLTPARALKYPAVVPVLICLDHEVDIELGETLTEILEENCRQETTREMLKNGNENKQFIFNADTNKTQRSTSICIC